MPAEITPPELAALVDYAERPRVDDWSLRSAITRYAQPQPVRASAVLELVRRIDFALKPHAKLIEREGPALWEALQSNAKIPDAGDRDDGQLVGLLRAMVELDLLGDVLAAWAVDRAGKRPDDTVDAVATDVDQRLKTLNVPREQRSVPTSNAVDSLGRMATVDPIPSNYPRLSPYLSIDGAAKAIDFYCDILGATVRARMDGPDGRVGHAELDLGTSVIMLSDTFPGGTPAPGQLGGSPVTLLAYVSDVDDVFNRAIKAGATEIAPLKDQFYGDRSAQFEDPFGHRWNVASHVEDVPPEEMERRAAEANSGG